MSEKSLPRGGIVPGHKKPRWLAGLSNKGDGDEEVAFIVAVGGGELVTAAVAGLIEAVGAQLAQPARPVVGEEVEAPVRMGLEHTLLAYLDDVALAVVLTNRSDECKEAGALPIPISKNTQTLGAAMLVSFRQRTPLRRVATSKIKEPAKESAGAVRRARDDFILVGVVLDRLRTDLVANALLQVDTRINPGAAWVETERRPDLGLQSFNSEGRW